MTDMDRCPFQFSECDALAVAERQIAQADHAAQRQLRRVVCILEIDLEVGIQLQRIDMHRQRDRQIRQQRHQIDAVELDRQAAVV